jgi:hypothetical protein
MTPPDDATTRLTLRLRSDLVEPLQDLEPDRSMNWLINQAVETYIEQRQHGDRSVVPAFPKSQFGQSGARFQAVLQWVMPMFEASDHPDGTPIGTEARIENALSRCLQILQEWGAQGEVMVHSIHSYGGDQLPVHIRRFPEGTLTIDKGALGAQTIEAGVLPYVVAGGQADRPFTQGISVATIGQVIKGFEGQPVMRVLHEAAVWTVAQVSPFGHNADDEIVWSVRLTQDTGMTGAVLTLYRRGDEVLEVLTAVPAEPDLSVPPEPEHFKTVPARRVREGYIVQDGGEAWQVMAVSSTNVEEFGEPSRIVLRVQMRDGDEMVYRTLIKDHDQEILVKVTGGDPYLFEGVSPGFTTEEERLARSVEVQTKETISYDAPDAKPEEGVVFQTEPVVPDTHTPEALEEAAEEALQPRERERKPL